MIGPRCVSPSGESRLPLVPDPDQTGLLLALLIVGVVGFAALGVVHVHLADGKPFKAQTRAKKWVISCVSVAQGPYLFIAFYAGFHLLSGLGA